MASKIAVGQSGVAHDSTLSARFQVLVAMDRDDGSPTRDSMPIDVVAAVDTGERPVSLFKHAAHPLAGDDLHGFVPEESRAMPSS